MRQGVATWCDAVHCIVLRCVAVCYSVLQCLAVLVLRCVELHCVALCCIVLQCVVVCCIVLQCWRCVELQCVEEYCDTGATLIYLKYDLNIFNTTYISPQHTATHLLQCCSVLQCVAVYCIVFQSVAV